MVRIKILEDDPADRDTLIECLRKYEREQGQSFSITAYDNPSDFTNLKAQAVAQILKTYPSHF